MIPSSDDAAAGPSPDERPATRRRSNPHQGRERRRRYVTTGLAIALVTLLVNAIVGENGYLAALRLKTEEAELAARVTALRLENQTLKEDARRLQHEPAALEEAAKAELGLVRPDETLVIIRDVVPAQGLESTR